MGNVFSCLHKPARKVSSITEQISFDSTTSITNLSKASTVEPVDTISTCPSTLTNLSSKFSWNRMKSVYIVAVESNTQQFVIKPETLAIMENIFIALENNIGKMSRIFYECMNEMDHSFPTYFEECAARNQKSLTVGRVLNERIRSHTLNMIHLHCKIIRFMETSKKEALNVMRLVAVSHVLMNVQPQSFILLNTVMAKFLLRSGILSEENAEYIVTYFNFITESITNYMRVQITHDLGFHNDSVARENYRNMKDWYAIVHALHKETDQIRNVESVSPTADRELSLQSPIPTEILKQDACFIKHFVKKKFNVSKQSAS